MASGGESAFVEVRDVGGGVVYALDGYLEGAEYVVQGYEGGTDYAACIAVFGVLRAKIRVTGSQELVRRSLRVMLRGIAPAKEVGRAVAGKLVKSLPLGGDSWDVDGLVEIRNRSWEV